MSKPILRRNFLKLAATAAAGVAAPPFAEASTPRQQDTRRVSPPTLMKTTANPPVLQPLDLNKHYNTNVTLECGVLETTIDGLPVKLRAYNSLVPGPLLVARGGDTLNINVINKLPPTSSAGWNGDMDVPHHFDRTNLHLHGLDIAPHIFEPLATDNPSAMMIAIPPGGSKQYPFVIPSDQSPGLNWYHPHSHGSTVVQAVSGMAGAIIIQGAIDEVPEIKAAKDYLLAVQDIALFSQDGPATMLKSYEPEQNAIWQTFSAGNVTKYDPETGKAVVQPELHCGFSTGDYDLRYYLVNGQPFFKEVHNPSAPQSPTPTQMDAPVITTSPGEVIRVRLLNACSDLMMPVQIIGVDMHLIAMDGNNFNAPRIVKYEAAAPQVVLGPANRAEFLIKCPLKTGEYPIVQLAQEEQFLSAVQKTIATIHVVSTEPMNMQLPTSLPPISRDPPITEKDIKRRRKFVFSSEFSTDPSKLKNPYVGIDFLINNQLYDELACPTVVALNECEEWLIEVPSSEHGGIEGHPFHIHVNDFEVISIAGIPQPPGLIQDTIWVQEETASVIRMRFKQWTGKSVFHCHILPHEETGMMQNFLILKERPQHSDSPSGGEHHHS